MKYLEIFLTLLMIKLTLQCFLLWRQFAYVQKHAHAVPTPFEDKITHQEHQKAANYTCSKLLFSAITLFTSTLILLAWIFYGLQALDQFVTPYTENETLRGLLFFGGFLVISLIISLPEDLYSTFVLEEKYGFNKTTLKTFITDLFKQLMLTVILGGIILWVLLSLMKNLGTSWWIWGWSFMTLFQLLLLWIYPTFIAPLFNKFSALTDSALVEKIEQLLQRTDFKHSGLFVMDASTRSSHGNAYFTGFGKSKRIVFFDTLLKGLDPEEVEAVLAHELGHFKRKHIVKMMLISFLMSFIGFYFLGSLYSSDAFYQSFGVARSTYMALCLFSLVLPSVTFFLTPLMSIFSRKHEYEADYFAAENSNAQSLITALVKLYKENANTLTPDPLYSKFYHSHPPALERIQHLELLMVQLKK